MVYKYRNQGEFLVLENTKPQQPSNPFFNWFPLLVMFIPSSTAHNTI